MHPAWWIAGIGLGGIALYLIFRPSAEPVTSEVIEQEQEQQDQGVVVEGDAAITAAWAAEVAACRWNQACLEDVRRRYAQWG